MIGTILKTPSDAAAVTERLVAHYGADRVWQVEQLSKHFFRAWLKDGTVALAIIQPEGEITIRELEAVG